MSHDGAPSDGSVLRLSVGRANPNGYDWEVVISAADYSKSRKLLYRAQGNLASLDQPPDEFLIEVHDEKRPVWTPMPLDHRNDVRTLISSLVLAAASVVKDAGHA
jgi:hypothetical protein